MLAFPGPARYPPGMSQHSLADAEHRLAELIDRALAGEAVVITRDGQPVVALQPVAAAPGAVTPEHVAWLRRHRAGRLVPGAPDAGELVSRMRDEDWT